MAESISGSVGDALRRYIDAVAGFTEVPRDRAEKIMSELAKRGETRARDLQKSARQLAYRSTRNRQELIRLIQKEIKRQVAVLGLASREEIDRLGKRVRQLEAERTTPSRPKTASKSVPKKKAAAKRPSATKKSGT